MSSTRLALILAERIMPWSAAPDRFRLVNRQWITRSRFQPLNHVQDAFRLLQKANSTLSLTRSADGVFTATVRIGGQAGCASGASEAATITLAVARAIGIQVDLPEEHI